MDQHQSLVLSSGFSSVRGSSHEQSGAPCQDYSLQRHFNKGTCCITVISDGAGSASRAEEGSKSLVNALTRHFLTVPLESNFTADSFQERVISTIASLRDELSKAGDLSDFHATLALVLRVERNCYTAHLGDGGITVALTKDKTTRFERSNPQNGEYSNETFFFTLDDWKSYLRFKLYKNVDYYVLASDGVDPFIWDAYEGVRQKFLIAVLQQLMLSKDTNAELAAILLDPRMDEGTNDDKSLAFEIIESQAVVENTRIVDNTAIYDKLPNLSEILHKEALSAHISYQQATKNEKIEAKQIGFRVVVVGFITIALLAIGSYLVLDSMRTTSEKSVTEISTDKSKRVNNGAELDHPDPMTPGQLKLPY